MTMISFWRMSDCIQPFVIIIALLLLLVIVKGEGSSSGSNLKDDPLVKMVCKVILTRRYVGLCQSDLEVLRVFGPVVSFLEEDQNTSWNQNIEFYPHSFYVRPRHSNDPIPPTKDNECGTNHNYPNLPITLLRVPLEVQPQSSSLQKYPKISTLSKLVQKKLNNDSDKILNQNYYSIMVQDSINFQQCVNQSLFQHEQQQEQQQEMFLLSWMTSTEAKSCRNIAKNSFEKISDWLSEIDDDDDGSNRKHINTILQSIVNVWGATPQLLAYFTLVNGGCNASDSYDEFTSCRFLLGDVILDMNIHKRNVDPNNIQHWQCETCGLHSVRPQNNNFIDYFLSIVSFS